MARLARSPVWPIVAILLALFLAHDLGAKQQQVFDPVALALASQPLRIHYIPDPNDIVNLVEGTPYTVPEGKVLIITDWTASLPASTNNIATVRSIIRLDGLDAWVACYLIGASGTGTLYWSSGGGSLSQSLRTGVRAEAGQVVTLDAQASIGNADMFASGYLAKAE